MYVQVLSQQVLEKQNLVRKGWVVRCSPTHAEGVVLVDPSRTSRIYEND